VVQTTAGSTAPLGGGFTATYTGLVDSATSYLDQTTYPGGECRERARASAGRGVLTARAAAGYYTWRVGTARLGNWAFQNAFSPLAQTWQTEYTAWQTAFCMPSAPSAGARGDRGPRPPLRGPD
jgi:hypothetical protein